MQEQRYMILDAEGEPLKDEFTGEVYVCVTRSAAQEISLRAPGSRIVLEPSPELPDQALHDRGSTSG